MKQALLLLFAILAVGAACAQNHSCGFDAQMNAVRNSTPQSVVQESGFNQNLRNYLNSQSKSSADYTIPVVFHILHDPADNIPIAGTSNPTDSIIHQGLGYLNESFRNLELYDTTQGVDVKIEFCLATQDTNGVYTTGITRHSGNTYIYNSNYPTFWQGANWDETQYLNIYIFSGSFLWGMSLSGFSSFPTSHGNPGDGFAVTHYTLTNPTSGSVITHEAGHYLGLYHTFQGGCPNQDCQVDGDRVCDTPPDASSSAPAACGDSINTCTSDTADLSLNNPFRPISLGGLGDQLDPIYNYMDYTVPVCRLQFTQGQKDRMHAALTQTRASLLTSPACEVVCTAVISPNFSFSVDTLIAGDTLYFTNTSLNGVYYQWYIDGVPVSTAIDTAWVFVNEGAHQVLLEVSNDSAACGVFSIAQTAYVHCDITTSISATVTDIVPGESITFTGLTSGATSYSWYLDGDSVDNTLSFTHTFDEPGMYEVQLKSSNGICPDSSAIVRVSVGHCKKGVDEKWVLGYETGWNFSGGTVSDFHVPGLNLSHGSASVADENGNLLFYTDGQTVWNAQNVQMANGDSLAYNSSGIQPVQILPVPGDSNLYYIFSSNTDFTNPETYYAMVDMRLDSARGDVISKKNSIASDDFLSFSATKHANGCDFWLIMRRGFPFEMHCFPVTANGVGAPVITALPGGYGQGQLDVSPNGKKIALGNGTYIVVADFDNATGQISNSYVLTQLQQFISAVLFSPGNNRLYATGYTNTANSDRLSQFDLTLGSAAAIQNSLQLISIPEAKLRSLKRGPDGKVYGALEYKNYLAGIEFPNELGASTHYSDQGTPNALLGYGRLYLPNTVPTFGVRNELALQGPISVCEGVQQVDYTISCSDSTLWTYAGGGSIDTSTNTFLRLNFGAAGVDTLVVWSSSQCGPILADTLIIQVIPISTVTEQVIACDTYTWIDSITYTSSTNTPTWTLINAQGCDSVVTLDLTIGDTSTVTEYVNACDAYTWIDGNTYTLSTNTPTWTLSNAQGCDSVVTLDLVLNSYSTGTDLVDACGSYTWIDGATYTASNASATHTLVNAAGCDSVVTLNLTVNSSSASTDTQVACDTYTWIDGNTYTNSNQTATHTLTNAVGCDSVITLDLTINAIDNAVNQIGIELSANETGAAYEWVDCDNNYATVSGETNQSFIPSVDGNYAVIITNNGCVDTSSCVSVVGVGVFTHSFGEEFKVYPNPTSGQLQVELGASYHNVSVIVTNELGQQVVHKQLLSGSLIELHIEGAAGNYFIHIETKEEQRAYFKVVKM